MIILKINYNFISYSYTLQATGHRLLQATDDRLLLAAGYYRPRITGFDRLLTCVDY